MVADSYASENGTTLHIANNPDLESLRIRYASLSNDPTHHSEVTRLTQCFSYLLTQSFYVPLGGLSRLLLPSSAKFERSNDKSRPLKQDWAKRLILLPVQSRNQTACVLWMIWKSNAKQMEANSESIWRHQRIPTKVSKTVWNSDCRTRNSDLQRLGLFSFPLVSASFVFL